MSVLFSIKLVLEMATITEAQESSNSGSNGDNTQDSNPRHRNRIPRRILHFSDGTLEEYSDDEEEEEEIVTKEISKELTAVDPKSLAWGAWFWYQTVLAGTKTLEACDYLGEALANFFGITTPKYQFEINHFEQMVAEEEALKRRLDMEMGGWVRSDGDNPVIVSSGDEPETTQSATKDIKSVWTHPFQQNITVV